DVACVCEGSAGRRERSQDVTSFAARRASDLLESAGSSMDHVVMNQIFLRNLEDYHKFNEIYVSYFPAILPARFCVKLEMVRPEFLVEIATTAVIPA
ncbi:Rid family hydrolase, partial [Pantoea sp. ME81]|uniref:Rid family hydrolase n=1 Tax=Pantoea sp. ME81 TaxID=2743935 RepID=UPI002108164D